MNCIKSLFLFISLILILFTIGCESQAKVPESMDSRVWARHWGSGANDIGNDIAIGETGVYITGVTLGELDNNNSSGAWDIFLTKYDFDGNHEWTVQWGTEGRDTGSGVIANKTGIYVTGYVNGSLDSNTYSGGDDIFLTKFDSAGTKQWTVQLGTKENNCGTGIAADSSGVYITGFTGGDYGGDSSAGKDDIFLSKFDIEGVLLWTRQWGTTEVDWGQDISVFNSKVYVTGFSKGNLLGNVNVGFNDIFLTEYSAQGEHQWTRQWGTKGNDEGNSVASNSSGIYITGRANGKLDGNKRIGLDDIFITKYTLDGVREWSKILGSKKNDNAYGVVVEGSDVYITGITDGELKGKISSGRRDIILAKYMISGETQWTKQWGTGGFDYGRAIALKGNEIYITGDSSRGPDGIRNKGDNRAILLQKWEF